MEIYNLNKQILTHYVKKWCIWYVFFDKCRLIIFRSEENI